MSSSSKFGEILISQFDKYDVKDQVWDNCIIRSRISTAKYIIQVEYGSDYESIPDKKNKHNSSSSSSSSSSPVYPNGLLTHSWFRKYVEVFPFAVVYICQLDSEGYEDDAMINNLKNFKLKLEAIDCKLILVVVTSRGLSHERQETIRTELNLPKAGALYHLNDTAADSDEECQILVSDLMPNITKLAQDFYFNIEYKIKQRSKKHYTFPPPSSGKVDTSIQLTPKFLETRNLIKQGIIMEFLNPRNLEPSIKILEIAYQELVNILDLIYTVDNNFSDHDNLIIVQFKTLLDVLAFHIVRGYFSIQEPIKALKKHKTHIVNVVEVLKSDHNWVSTQYEWLAQLMRLIPYTILSNLNTTAILKMLKDGSTGNKTGGNGFGNVSKLLSYFGGIHTPEFDLITNPGLIYVKAYEMNNDPMKRIDLLGNAIVLLEINLSNANRKNSISGKDNLYSLISYINWLIAEEYFKLKEYHKASDYLEMAYSSMGTTKWFNISHIILEKLLICYIKIENKSLELNTILKLGTMPKDPVRLNNFNQNSSENLFQFHENNDILEIDLLDSKLHEVFDVEVLLIDKNLSRRKVTVADDVVLQLTLKSKLNIELLKSFLPKNSEISIFVNQVNVSFARNDGKIKLPGLKNISIGNDSSKPEALIHSLHGQELENTFVDSANLAVDKSSDGVIILLHTQYATAAGSFLIEVVKLQISVLIKHNGKCIKLNKIELHQTFPNKFHYNYYPHCDVGDLKLDSSFGVVRKIRLDQPGHIITVHRKKPEISISLEKNVDFYIPSERLALPILISFNKRDLALFNNNGARAMLIAKVKNNDVTLTWDDLKDDEPLNLLSQEKESDTHVLNVYTRFWKDSQLTIDFELLTLEEKEDESAREDSEVHSIASIAIPVLSSPLRCKYSIGPVFVENANEYEESQRLSILNRTWRSMLEINDELQLQSKHGESLDIVDIEYNIISRNPEISIDFLNKEEGSNNQLFSTRSKNKFTFRNVATISSVSIKWKRKHKDEANWGHDDGNATVNVYRSPEWAITLPLSQPRVLLVAQSNADISDDVLYLQLKYILENPSPNGLTFTTQLIDFEEDWVIVEDKGKKGTEDMDMDMDTLKVAISQAPFTVSPVSSRTMVYHLRNKNPLSSLKTKLVKLPNFKVFDINYKVGLTTLTTQSIVKLNNQDHNLYLVV
ncbi:hypothetical protein KGF56_000683 [Candida oxycetoniae]|uniref:Trafficking protein particle complex subunit 11 domain-containing protein n=1 Tax=Candida oxycetoniae TaxID=497107 RepID=A0AAI9WZL9_9ASCO|nr:uncharacterized protein KGF56_000683 [Candida oxycetoniae]KAI3406551.2 hypothetical protein KGF56_000683 [Candida oxycetoniae]